MNYNRDTGVARLALFFLLGIAIAQAIIATTAYVSGGCYSWGRTWPKIELEPAIKTCTAKEYRLLKGGKE